MEIVENSSFQQFADKKPFVKGKNTFAKGLEPYFFADFCVFGVALVLIIKYNLICIQILRKRGSNYAQRT